MKAAFRIHLALFLSLVSLIHFSFAKSERLTPPQDSLLGAWAGYEEGGAYFYYLTLQSSSAGTCEVLFADGTVDSYTVEDWHIEAGKLLLRLSPTTKNAEKIRITVEHFDTLRMDFAITGPSQEWRRKAALYSEKELLERMEVCRRHSKPASTR